MPERKKHGIFLEDLAFGGVFSLDLQVLQPYPNDQNVGSKISQFLEVSFHK